MIGPRNNRDTDCVSVYRRVARHRFNTNGMTTILEELCNGTQPC